MTLMVTDKSENCAEPLKVACFLCGKRMTYEGARAEVVDGEHDIVYTWTCPCASTVATMTASQIKHAL